MLCNHCKQENRDDASICVCCGRSLDTKATAPDESTAIPCPPEGLPFEEMPSVEPVLDSADSTELPLTAVEEKKSKGRWLLIPAVLVSLALVAFLVATLLRLNSPQVQLMKGISNSAEELRSNLETAETFRTLLTNSREALSNREYSLDVKLVNPNGSDYIQYTMANSRLNKVSRTDLRLCIEGIELGLTAATDENLFMLQLEQLEDDLYTLPMSHFGQSYKGSKLAAFLREDLGENEDFQKAEEVLELLDINPYADTSYSAFRLTNNDLETQIQELVIKKTDTPIPNAGDLTVYRTELALVKLVEIYEKYATFQWQAILGAEAAEKFLAYTEMVEDLYEEAGDTVIVLYLGLNDNKCLTALHGHPAEDPADSLTVILAGKENIWNEILFYEGEEKTAALTLDDTDHGFTAALTVMSEGDALPAFTLECKDDSQELLISTDSVEEPLVIRYTTEGTSSVLTFADPDEEEFKATVTLSSVPAIELPTGEAVSLLTYGEDEFQDLLIRLLQTLMGL